jgi:CheY-like chemotaxis protein
MMGGEIGVDSEPGGGATFWFTARLDILEDRESAPPCADLSGIRVLIVDDNSTNRAILLHQVTALGAACEVAADGAAGLEAMRAAHARDCPYHLALIDMKMPRMDGIELLRAVRADAALRHTRLAMLTSMSAAGELALAAAAGADVCMTKPVRRDELWNTLARLAGAITPAVPAPPAAAATAPVPDRRATRVLLADDNGVNQVVARAMLVAAGCEVTIARNGREAVEHWRAHPYDLILMDCQMPELDGFEATREIRALETAQGARVPIVALTASAMEGDRERCLGAGMDDYLSKPFTRRDLMAVLQRWLACAPPEPTSRQASTAPAAV